MAVIMVLKTFIYIKCITCAKFNIFLKVFKYNFKQKLFHLLKFLSVSLIHTTITLNSTWKNSYRYMCKYKNHVPFLTEVFSSRNLAKSQNKKLHFKIHYCFYLDRTKDDLKSQRETRKLSLKATEGCFSKYFIAYLLVCISLKM